MFKNASIQTKSFVVLILIALFGGLFALWLAGYINSAKQIKKEYSKIQVNNNTEIKANNLKPPTEPAVLAKEIADTSNWKEYTDTKYGISFKYNPDWKIKPWTKNKEGYDVLEIDPGRKYYNIKIYASDNSFYVMDGLPTQSAIIGGVQALDVSDLLYGVKKDKTYLTFDLGLSLSLKPQFSGLIESVKFH